MPQENRIILPTALKDEAHEIRGALATLQAIAAYLPQLPNGIGSKKLDTAQLQIRRITDCADRIRLLAEEMESEGGAQRNDKKGPLVAESYLADVPIVVIPPRGLANVE